MKVLHQDLNHQDRFYHHLLAILQFMKGLSIDILQLTFRLIQIQVQDQGQHQYQGMIFLNLWSCYLQKTDLRLFQEFVVVAAIENPQTYVSIIYFGNRQVNFRRAIHHFHHFVHLLQSQARQLMTGVNQSVPHQVLLYLLYQSQRLFQRLDFHLHLSSLDETKLVDFQDRRLPLAVTMYFLQYLTYF